MNSPCRVTFSFSEAVAKQIVIFVNLTDPKPSKSNSQAILFKSQLYIHAEKKQRVFSNDFIYITFESDKNEQLNVLVNFSKPHVSKRTKELALKHKPIAMI